MPLLRRYLDDDDVLTKLLVTGKVMKPDLDNWPVESNVNVETARDITQWDRYARVIVKHIYDYQGEDIARHTELESLTTHRHFDTRLMKGDLPLSLTKLILGKAFNQPIGPGVLPPRLKVLYFGDSFNQLINPVCIPMALTEASFGRLFNQPLAPGVIPVTVTALCLGESFNQPLQPGSLPPCTTQLILGKHFSQPLAADVMPPGLESLDFDAESKFGNTLFLPQTLSRLALSSPLAGIHLTGTWPLLLCDLTLGPDTEPLPAGRLPASLEILEVNQPIVVGSVPAGVTVLSYHTDHPIPAGAIPNTVTCLRLSESYNQQVLPAVIPDLVTHLQFGNAFNQLVLPRSIPSSVTHIAFGEAFIQILVPCALPQSIVCLDIHRTKGVFNQMLLTADVSIPSTSTFVTIGSVPRSVTHLILGRDFNQPLLPDSIPPSVTHLALGKKFNQPLSSDVLPASLKQLLVAVGGAVHVGDDVMAHVKEDDKEFFENWWTVRT